MTIVAFSWRLLGGAGLLLALSGCNRIDHIGKPPSMTPLGRVEESRRLTTADVVRNLPTPSPPPALPSQPGSLWQTGSQNFFNDNRAQRVGDLVTVLIDIDEEANFENKTDRSRASDETLGTPNFFGLETKLQKILPNAVDPENLVKIQAGTTSGGSGKSGRKEKVQLRMAAVVTTVLPNGNFVITGSQELRVNFDLRELQVAGIVRPQDITGENTVTYDKIGEARLSYGGRGQLQDLQQPRYGQQVLDVLLPY